MMSKPVSEACRKMVRQFEGERLHSYRCPAGVWTISVGVTGPHVKQGMVVSQAESDAMFAEALQRFADGVDRAVTVPITENQRSALISLSYNIGLKAFQNSTLVKFLNRKQFSQAAEQFERWIHASGAVLPALVARRRAEKELFLTPDGPPRRNA